MRRLINIITEAHHSYDNPDYNTRFQPMKNEDTVRVFHGFYSMEDAAKAAVSGLSGKERADRRHSYESDNNPNGLFVSLSIEVCKEFTTRGAIMEFTANMADLEAPVWPSGSYTAQGQMAQYFGHGAKGRAARRAKHKDLSASVPDLIKHDPDYTSHIPQSDDLWRAYLLTTGREYQALFVGHLNPQDIAAFWVSKEPHKSGNYAEWTRLTPDEFISMHDPKKHLNNRIFLPNEPFDGDEFLRRMSAKFRWKSVDAMMRNTAEHIREVPHAAQQFISYFQPYLWPKQYVPAMRWLIRTYGKSES